MPACGFAGLIGAVALPDRAHAQLLAAIDALVPALGLVGLCSIDFLLHEEAIQVLEVNPRPSASLSLYDEDYAGGLMQAHVHACVGEDAPAVRQAASPKLRGEMIVFAPADLVVDASSWVNLSGVHDLPIPGTRFKAGAPVCTVSASGRSVAKVHEALVQAAHRAFRLLSQPTPAHTGAVT
jgi:predicted ATP-grasp superfamily ATP-dependent carboligase